MDVEATSYAVGKGISEVVYYAQVLSMLSCLCSGSGTGTTGDPSGDMMIVGTGGEVYIVDGTVAMPIYMDSGSTFTFFEEDKNEKEIDSETEIKSGDKTPKGREYTQHDAERANERSFTSEQIDNIIDNNYKHRIKEIDKFTGEITWRYQDSRGNTVITNEWGDKIVTVYSCCPAN